jgi:glycosyltransferase involved in cell wall biosynthesis
MRVLIDAVGIREGGGASVLEELLNWLPAARPDWDWQVMMLPAPFRHFEPSFVSPRVRIRCSRFGNGAGGRLAWLLGELPALAGRYRPDVVLAFANIASPLVRPPKVVYCHQPNLFLGRHHVERSFLRRMRLRAMRALVLRGAASSQATIVQTHFMRRRMVEAVPGLDRFLHVIPSGYRTVLGRQQVRPQVADRVTRAGTPRLIYIAHPYRHKNHDNLLRAMALVVRRHPSATLMLTVDGEPDGHEDRVVTARLRQLEAELGLGPRLVWLGRINPDEVAFALRQSTLHVFPSLAESFGVPLAESLAMGCAVVASDLGFAHEVSGPAAEYFDPSNPAGIAGKILSVLEDPDRIGSLRREALARARLFHYRPIAESIARVLEGVIG